MSKASDQAYNELRARILSGELPSGTQLKEEELAALVGVSRTPIREAIRKLESEFYITRSDSQRSFVTEWSADDMAEIFALRSRLEGYAASSAARNIDEETLAELDAINDALAELLSRPTLDTAGFVELNGQFHSRILSASRSRWLAGLLSRLALQPMIHQTAARYTKREVEQSYMEHSEIAKALRKRDADWAEAMMIAHIRRAFHARVIDREIS